METVLKRSGLSTCPAALGGLGFGLLLYLAALQALGAGTKGSNLPPPASPCHPAKNPVQWQKQTTGRHRP